MHTEMTRKEELVSIFWDAYKDVHGFRPRHIDTASMTEEQLELELQALEAEGEVQFKAEQARQAENITRFEANVQNVIASGAGDRATALRWIHQAQETDGDDEYLCYRLDLPYGYFKKQA